MSVADKTIDWPALIDVARKRKSFLLADLSWHELEDFLEASAQQHLRYTYDRGRLEVMPTSFEHEVYGWLLGMFVAVLAEEYRKHLCAGGQTTFNREDLDRGLQPDGCFWLANAHRVAAKKRLDVTIDPPPDIFIEVEVSRTILDRLAVLAALGVAEVWRYHDGRLQVGLLQRDERYSWTDASPTFPTISMAGVVSFLGQVGNQADHLGIVQAFREWVRAQLQKRQ